MIHSYIRIILTCLTFMHIYAASSKNDYSPYLPSYTNEYSVAAPIGEHFFSFFDSLTVVRSRSDSTSYTDPHTFVACVGIGTYTQENIPNEDQRDNITETINARDHLPIHLYPGRVTAAVAGIYNSAVFHWYVSTGTQCAWRWHKSLTIVKDQELKPNAVSKLMASFGVVVPHELLSIAETVYAEQPDIFNQESIPTLLQALQYCANACHIQHDKHRQNVPVLVTDPKELTWPLILFYPHLRLKASKEQFAGIARLFDDADSAKEADDRDADELSDDDYTNYCIQEHFRNPLEDDNLSLSDSSVDVHQLFEVDTSDY